MIWVLQNALDPQIVRWILQVTRVRWLERDSNIARDMCDRFLSTHGDSLDSPPPPSTLIEMAGYLRRFATSASAGKNLYFILAAASPFHNAQR